MGTKNTGAAPLKAAPTKAAPAKAAPAKAGAKAAPKSGIVKVELDVQTAKTLLAALLQALGGNNNKKKGKGKK